MHAYLLFHCTYQIDESVTLPTWPDSHSSWRSVENLTENVYIPIGTLFCCEFVWKCNDRGNKGRRLSTFYSAVDKIDTTLGDVDFVTDDEEETNELESP